MYTNIILTLILLVLLFDLYQKNSIIIKKRINKTKDVVIKRKSYFWVRKKWFWDKVIEDLEKDIS